LERHREGHKKKTLRVLRASLEEMGTKLIDIARPMTPLKVSKLGNDHFFNLRSSMSLVIDAMQLELLANPTIF
jgi:hypothetical protein